MEAVIGTLYDINKNGYKKMSPITDEKLNSIKFELTNFIKAGKYFMLLNKEQSDYTIFNFINNADYIANEVIECLKDRGKIIDIDKQDNNSYECWIRRSGLMYMYLLFPYDAAVIEG